MKKSKIIQVGGKEIIVKELTVAEIADCMDSVMAGAGDLTDTLMEETSLLPSQAVVMSTGIDRADLLAMAPSALEPIWGAVLECNPFFGGMLRRVADRQAKKEKIQAQA